MTIYANILETVGGVIKVNKLGPEGVDIYVKCEFFNPCGSVKDRCDRADAWGSAPPPRIRAFPSARRGPPLASSIAERVP